MIHFSAPGGQPEADVGTQDVCGSEAQPRDVSKLSPEQTQESKPVKAEERVQRSV